MKWDTGDVRYDQPWRPEVSGTVNIMNKIGKTLWAHLDRRPTPLTDFSCPPWSEVVLATPRHATRMK